MKSWLGTFVFNVSARSDDANNKDFKKFKVRGNMVNFSPAVINKLMGRPVERQAKLEIVHN